jgi:hypothetical protein
LKKEEHPLIEKLTMEARAEALVAGWKGFITVEDFANVDVNRVAIQKIRSRGLIENAAWGVYISPEARAEAGPLYDLALVNAKFPRAVFCLQTAAAFHGITQDVMEEATAFVPRSYGAGPKMGREFTAPVDYIVTRRESVLEKGVEWYEVGGGCAARITTPERTLVDMFRYSTRGTEGNYDALIEAEAYRVCVERCVDLEDRGEFDFDEAYMIAAEFDFMDALINSTADIRHYYTPSPAP